MEVEERPPVSLQSIRKEMEGCGSLVEFKPFPIMTGKPPITSICASCHASGAALCCKNCRYFYFCSSECAKNCNSRHLERCANMEPTINDAVNAMFRESRISEPAPHEVFWLTSHGIDLKQFVPTAANLPNVTTTHRLFEPLLLRDTQKWDAELKAWRCAVWASEIKQDLVREVLMKTGMPVSSFLVHSRKFSVFRARKPFQRCWRPILPTYLTTMGSCSTRCFARVVRTQMLSVNSLQRCSNEAPTSINCSTMGARFSTTASPTSSSNPTGPSWWHPWNNRLQMP